MSELQSGQRVILSDGRYGRVIETAKDWLSGGLTQQQQRVLAVRVWIDGEAQPEIDMRKPGDMQPA